MSHPDPTHDEELCHDEDRYDHETRFKRMEEIMEWEEQNRIAHELPEEE